MKEKERLYKDKQDFLDSLDKGRDLIDNMKLDCPAVSDEENLKNILAVLITATIEPEQFSDPQLGLKIAGVRIALGAAYNLGRERGKDEKQV